MPWTSWLLSWFGFAEFAAPSIDFTFTLSGGPMAAGTGIVKVTDSNALLSIASIPGTVAVGSNPPVAFDAINGPSSVACNEGDTITVTARSVSKGGVASAEATATFTAIDRTTVPVAPAVDFSFAVSPAVAPS